MKQRNLKLLAEALKGLSKYPDHELIDYWRTIQGTPVGFHGKVGSGVPVAGPAVLTSNDATSNPLMKPLLSKYKPNTFIGDAIRKKNFPVSVINFIENFVGKDDAEINARFAKMERRLLNGISNRLRINSTYEGMTKAQKDYASDMEAKFTEKFFDKSEYQKDFFTSDGEKIAIYGPNPRIIGFSYDDEGNRIMVVSHKHKDIPEVAEFVEQVKKGFPKSEANSIKSVTMSELKNAWETKGVGSVRNRQIFDIMDYSIHLCEDVFDYHESPHFSSTSKESSRNEDYAFELLKSHFVDPAGQSSILYKVAQIEGVAGQLVAGDSGKNTTKELFKKKTEIEYDDAKEFMGDLYALNQVLMRAKGIESEKVFRSFGRTIPTMGSESDSVRVITEIGKNKVPVRFVNRPIAGFAADQATFRGLGVSAEIPSEAILSSFNGVRLQGDQHPDERETLVIGASSLRFDHDQVGAVGDLIKSDENGNPIDENGNTIAAWSMPRFYGAVISSDEIVKILSGEEGLNEVLAKRKIVKLNQNGTETPQFQYFAAALADAGVTDKHGKPLLDKYSQYAKGSAEWMAAKLAAGDFKF